MWFCEPVSAIFWMWFFRSSKWTNLTSFILTWQLLIENNLVVFLFQKHYFYLRQHTRFFHISKWWRCEKVFTFEMKRLRKKLQCLSFFVNAASRESLWFHGLCADLVQHSFRWWRDSNLGLYKVISGIGANNLPTFAYRYLDVNG